MTRTRRAVYYLAPVFLCLAVYWRAPFTWFRMDDFAWLSLPQRVGTWSAFVEIFFSPQAQGTIRIFSERLYFTVLAGVFGLNGGVFHAVGMSVWFVDLALLQSIGARLTGSRAAGLLAALLWTVNSTIATPLDWASCFNQVLCAFCILAAFHSRLRWLESGEPKWRWFEALAYLAGFGVLEVIVMYPAVVLLHACVDARAKVRWRSAVWMLAPAALFTAAHLLLIPKTSSPVYQLVVDARVPSTLLRYVSWAVDPIQMFLVGVPWITPGRIATRLIGFTLAVFLIWRVARGDRMVLFFAGWFLLWIAPVLPLPNHLIEYYDTIPGIGLAWLAGAALVAAWRSSWRLAWFLRASAVILAGAYVAGSIAEVHYITSYHLRAGSRMRMVVRAAQAELAEHPVKALVFRGVDNDLFRGGFRDNPFLLLGVERVWLAPGDEAALNDPELGDVSRFRTTADALLPLLDSGQARVINVSEDHPRDATRAYRQVLGAQALAEHGNRVLRTADPFDSARLGEGWFKIENGARWMGKRATVTLAGPPTAAEKLYVTGYLTGGPVRLTIRAAGREIASVPLMEQNRPFTIQTALPQQLVGAYAMEVTLECSRTFRAPNDTRDLGVVVAAFEVR